MGGGLTPPISPAIQTLFPSDLSDIKKYIKAVDKIVSELIRNVTCLEDNTKAIIISDHSVQHENSSIQPLHASVAPVAETKTFAAVVSFSFDEAVKSAIEHTMQKQKATKRGDATITIRNLGEWQRCRRRRRPF